MSTEDKKEEVQGTPVKKQPRSLYKRKNQNN